MNSLAPTPGRRLALERRARVVGGGVGVSKAPLCNLVLIFPLTKTKCGSVLPITDKVCVFMSESSRVHVRRRVC